MIRTAEQVQVCIAGQQYRLQPGETTAAHGISFALTSAPDYRRYTLSVATARPVSIDSVVMTLPFSYSDDDLIFCNGFQSWSESRLYTWREHLPNLRRLARPFMGYYGDYHFDFIRRGRGYLHSWTWTTVQSSGSDSVQLLASLQDTQAFTCWQHDRRAQQLTATLDTAGWRVHGHTILLDVVLLTGVAQDCYDRWFEWLQLEPPRAPVATGWTSWYQYYTQITAAQLRTDSTAAHAQGLHFDFFQIDDGYAQHVGDWLDTKDTFPGGMAPLAAHIRQCDMIPGLWLAPPVASGRSRLVRDHPEWIERTARGQPLRAGYNPLWGGWFYALNVDHPGWRAATERVFRTALDEWGYGLLKLDFLYAACIQPPTDGRTRAQRLHAMLRFFRTLAGEHYLLGCGVPLAPGFGVWDYCRIGADVHLHWEHGMLRWLRHRERVSTHLALRNTLGRWPLDGRAWRNDPDVFLLRKDNLHLSAQQKATLLRLNTWLGSLLFTSDPPGDYGPASLDQHRWLRDNLHQRVHRIAYLGPDLYRLHGEGFTAWCNLTSASYTVLPGVVVPAYGVRVDEAGTGG